jgi:hypothetical protein
MTQTAIAQRCSPPFNFENWIISILRRFDISFIFLSLIFFTGIFWLWIWLSIPLISVFYWNIFGGKETYEARLDEWSRSWYCTNCGGVSVEQKQVSAKNGAKAGEKHRKSATQGHAEAQYKLGVGYADGQGVAKEEAQAVNWFQKAADLGHAEAQYKLGVRYADGQGVAKDEAQAVNWFQKAAEQGHAEAQYTLGIMYADGRGVARDDAQAIKWFRKAAEQGHGIRNSATK